MGNQMHELTTTARRNNGMVMDTETNVSSIAPPLCPNCGYRLEGLPNGTRCPECGEESSEGLILYGYALGFANPGLVNRRASWRMIPLIIFWTFPIIQLSISSFVIGRTWINPWMIGLLALNVTLFLVIRIIIPWHQGRRGYASPPYPVQTRFSSNGFGQRNGFGNIKCSAWNKYHRLILDQRPRGRCRIKVEDGHPMATVLSFEFDAPSEHIGAVLERLIGWAKVRGVEICHKL